jgi:putative molybdopterin biosynthesis protein
MERKIFLEDIPLDDAIATFIQAISSLGLWKALASERIELEKARDRITAEPVWALISSPHYHASAMDGYALKSQDTAGASETNPIRFRVVRNDLAVPGGGKPALPVNTGQPLPSWADCVVMVEKTQPVEGEHDQPKFEIYNALPPWNHVRPMGEDIVTGELILPANHRLRPVDVGAMAAAGHAYVSVYRKPRVAIIPTGSELIRVGSKEHKKPLPGQIIEFNSLVLAAQVEEWGGIATRWPIIPDKFEAIQSAVAESATNHDLILVNAGSSAGTEDYTANVVDSLGDLLVHGVAVRPGHPVILGLIDLAAIGELVESTQTLPEKVPIIGVPGYPVSAAITGELFVKPLLARWQGLSHDPPQVMKATVTRKISSHTGDDDFVRVALGKVGDDILATPLNRGAGVISSLVRADGLVKIPRFSEGVDSGSEVEVSLYRSRAEIAQTILVIGSHDMVLDLLAQYLAQEGSGRRLTSANVGSLGGLVALGRGEAHLAGSHLLDQESGLYNETFVRRYLPDRDIVLLTLVGREQGWIVLKGNPKGLKSWQDTANPDIRIVNRQRGSGTRHLLDFALKRAAIEPEHIQGYNRQEYTHLAVAAAVASGTADAGLGIRAAANALSCDFVPLASERFDLVIPNYLFESDHLQPLIGLLYDPKFQQAVKAMPGYDVSLMGQKKFLPAKKG